MSSGWRETIAWILPLILYWLARWLDQILTTLRAIHADLSEIRNTLNSNFSILHAIDRDQGTKALSGGKRSGRSGPEDGLIPYLLF